MRQFKKYIIDPGLSDTNWKVLFLYLIYVLACNSLSLYTYLLTDSCYGLTNCHLIWPCIGYDSEMPSNSISEHLFFKIFSGGHSYPQTPSISMLPMLIVLCTIACINDHLSFMQAALQLVALTTKELLPMALNSHIATVEYFCIVAVIFLWANLLYVLYFTS